MSYWIMVFTKTRLRPLSEADVLAGITGSNFQTLCDQYGLDPAMIQPASEHLAVDLPTGDQLPLFMLRYQTNAKPPIVVAEWDVSAEEGSRLLKEMGQGLTLAEVLADLEQTRFIYSVELVETQLEDMGLLLGYELARWLAQRGSGIILGLDRKWYRLNPYQAFIPIE